jgi:hypothetical protein
MARASSGWHTRKPSFSNGKTSNLVSTSCHYLAFTRSVMQSCSTPHRMKNGRIIHVILPVAGWPATRLGRESACQNMPPGPMVFCRPLGVREYFCAWTGTAAFFFVGSGPELGFICKRRTAFSDSRPAATNRRGPNRASRPGRTVPVLTSTCSPVATHGLGGDEGAAGSRRPHRALPWPRHPDPTGRSRSFPTCGDARPHSRST